MTASRADAVDARLAAALERVPVLSAGDPGDIELLGGWTNRNYRVTVAGRRFVVRLPGQGAATLIDRAVERHNAAVAAAAGLAPPVAFFDERDGLCVTVDSGSSLAITAAAEDAATRSCMARTLRRLHRLDRSFRGRFHAITAVERHVAVLPAGTLPPEFAVAFREVAAASHALQRAAGPAVPCHHDPWPPNFVGDLRELRLVDWEYSAMGDPAWDLAHLVVEAGLGPEEERHLLEEYEPDPPTALADRVVVYPPLTDLVWSAWGFVEARNVAGVMSRDYALERLARCRALLATARFRDALARLGG